MERRLTAILAADVVGYSRLMGADEVGTLAQLKRLRAEVIEPRSQSPTDASSVPLATAFLSNSPAQSTRCSVRSKPRRDWLLTMQVCPKTSA